ncbi:MAG: DUF460 domain-containing protein [Candidatus Anstonellaceae archaeon]
MKYYIVGVDPGNNIGIAFLNLNGKIEETITIVGSIEDSIKKIQQVGKPAIIASDVNPAPQFVIRLASYFNSKLYVPKNIFREEQKWKITREYEKKENKKICKTVHERDAIFAAIVAYREYQNVIRNILSLDIEEKEEVAYLVLQGYRTESAIEMIKNKNQQPQQIQQQKTQPQKIELKYKTIDKKIEKENVELKKRIAVLEQQLLQANNEIKKLKNENYQKILKDREIVRLKTKINTLKRIIQILKLKKTNPKQKQKKEVIQKKEENKHSNDLKELDINILMKIVEEYRKEH